MRKLSDDSSTISGRLRQHAEARGNHPAVSLLGNDATITQSLSYIELFAKAQAFAGGLHNGGIARGDRVALVFDTEMDFLGLLFGVWALGAVAVPLWPPLSWKMPTAYLLDLEVLVRDCGAKILLTSRSLKDRLFKEGVVASFPCQICAAPEVEAAAQECPPLQLSPRHLALLQYTSGSTSRPRGVMLTHGNIVANVAGIGEATRARPGAEVICSWLPIQHDMGLIATICYAFHFGFPLYLMPPLHFLSRPTAWLQAIARYGATQSAAPDFAYAFAARRYDPAMLDGFSLAGWRTAVIGAEPIRRSTLELFADRFRPHGFSSDAFCPSYGLAEHTVAATMDRTPSRPRYLKVVEGSTEPGHAIHPAGDGAAGIDYVSVGTPLTGHHLLVVDENHEELQAGVVGEIALVGPSVSPGYFQRNSPCDSIEDDRSPRNLLTGDLGFVHNGELFITGRKKDLVIIRGRNYYPHDIEAVAAEAASLIASRLAAFSVNGTNESERLVLVCESRPLDKQKPREIFNLIDTALANRLGIRLGELSFIRRGGIPKTQNNKTRRLECRRDWLGGRLDLTVTIARDPETDDGPRVEESAGSPIQTDRDSAIAILLGVLREVLGLERLGISEESLLSNLGIDSLSAARLQYILSERYGFDVPLQQLLGGARIGDIALSQYRPNRSAAVGVALPTPETDVFEPSEIQRAYWIGRMASEAGGQVNAHLYVELSCPALDVLQFEQAFDRLLKRHKMLRAILGADGLLHVSSKAERYRISETDVRSRVAADREKHLEAIREELSRGFSELDQWPLFDIRLTRISANEHRLHIGMDLVVADAQSLLILLSEWVRFYQFPNLELPPVGISFQQYLAARQARLAGNRGRLSRAFWQGRMEALPLPPDLPFKERGQGNGRPVHRRLSRFLNAPLARALEASAKTQGTTLSVVFLTAYASSLAAWSAAKQFSLNITVFDREPFHQDVDRVIGDFTNLLPLDIDARGRPCPTALARQIALSLSQLLDHRWIDGIALLREYAEAKGRRDIPALPVVFTAVLGQRVKRSIAEIERGLGRLSLGLTKTPQVFIDCQVLPAADGIHLVWDYREDLFYPGVAEEMFASFHGLLEKLATDIDSWERAPLLVPEAQLSLRAKINRTNAPRLDRERLTDPFLRSVVQHPRSAAVISNDVTLSYEVLAARSRGLSERLRGVGGGPGRLIAVIMEKSWAQVVGVMGTLLCGAAYFPLDPGLPRDRIVGMLENSGVSLALIDERLREALGLPDSIHAVSVDSAPISKPAFGAAVSDVPDLAYVIATSGSTGQPKGVMIEHASALNTIRDINRRFAMTSSDAVLALSSLCFDLSVYDIFGLLAAGGTIVFPTSDAAREPREWIDLIVRHRVTIWNSVPALMELLVSALERRNSPIDSAVRLVLLSGDFIAPSLPPRIRRFFPNACIVALGGATEASVWSIYHTVEEADRDRQRIPYGRPLENQTFHVLDGDLCPLPTWVVGDLYIGGKSLARGYFRDPERTSKSFFVHPETDERLYATGDIGRYLQNGEIDILGRRDDQVKISGYRIEPGEIEAAFLSHSAVNRAAVIARGDRGRESLAAFIEAPGSEGPIVEDISRHVSRLLPEYMVPKIIHLVPNLPLTTTGKIDKEALCRLSIVSPCAHTAVNDPPQGEIERRIALIWTEALGVRQIGRRDNFFSLGGNSLLAIKAVTRLREALGFDLTIRELFENATIAGLVALAQKRTRTIEPGPAPTTHRFHTSLRHEFLRPLECSFVTGPSARELVEIKKRLEATFTAMGHRIHRVPSAASDLVLTTTRLNEPFEWLNALLFTGPRLFGLTRRTAIYTLIWADERAFLDGLHDVSRAADGDQKALGRFAGLAETAGEAIAQEARIRGQLPAFGRVLQAQCKCHRVVLIVGDTAPKLAVHFDLVGCVQLSLPSASGGLLDDLALRIVTAAAAQELDAHVRDGAPMTGCPKELRVADEMCRASRELDGLGFFSPIVRLDQYIETDDDFPLDALLSRQYSEGCFATYSPTLEATAVTASGGAAPVNKGQLRFDDIVFVQGLTADAKGVVIRPSAQNRTACPSVEAAELVGIDLDLAWIESEEHGVRNRVPVCRSKLHGHRAVISYDPDRTAFTPVEDIFQQFPVTCATDAQATATRRAFLRCDALRSPTDPRTVAFTIQPGHGVILVEKWVPGRAPFEELIRAMKDGRIVMGKDVPPGRHWYEKGPDGRMHLRHEPLDVHAALKTEDLRGRQ